MRTDIPQLDGISLLAVILIAVYGVAIVIEIIEWFKL